MKSDESDWHFSTGLSPTTKHEQHATNSLFLSDCSADAFHFQIAFSPNHNTGYYEDSHIHGKRGPGPDSDAEGKANQRIQSRQRVADFHRFLERYSSVDHLVVYMTAIRDKKRTFVAEPSGARDRRRPHSGRVRRY